MEVVDGTTLIFSRKQVRSTIILYGIEAPAAGKPYASEAKKNLQNLVLNKKITACRKKTRLGIAYEIHVLKGFMVNVNRMMVRKGFARSTVDEYAGLEKSARKKSLRLWSHDNQPAPKQYTQSPPASPAAQGHGVVAGDKNAANASGSFIVYKLHDDPHPQQAADNATQLPDPGSMEPRQAELETIRKKEQDRISDESLDLTYINDFSIKAYYRDPDYETDGFFEIVFDYKNTTLNQPVYWDDGEINCDCRVTGHFSEGTSTRIARARVLLRSYSDRVFIDVPSSYFEQSFVDLNSCTIECRISAGIFDLKASDKVYLQFNGMTWFFRHRRNY